MTAPARRRRRQTVIAPSAAQLALCKNRKIGHRWNLPENTSWEGHSPFRLGRRAVEAIKMVGHCDRCDSSKYVVFGVDHRNRLLDAQGQPQYDHSEDYKKFLAENKDLTPGQMLYAQWQDAQ